MYSSYPSISQENVERYLNVLGTEKKKQSVEVLSELISAHLFNVPFENISKLYYRAHRDIQSLPSMDLFLEGIENFHFGGTCYTNNYYFNQLLENLGYKIKLCGADMSNPDVHIVNIVKLEELEYLVDVGFAAPFWIPMPLHLDVDYTFHFGKDRYVLKPKDAAGCLKMELYRDGELKHGYLVNPISRHIQEFENVIADSFRDEATFMNAILLAKFSPKHSYIVHNMTAIEYQDNESNIRKLKNADELVHIIYEWFGISEEFSIAVCKQIDQLKDVWN